MKLKIIPIVASIALLLVACGSSQKDSNGNSLSKEEETALELVKNQLKVDQTIQSYEFVNSTIPTAFNIDFSQADRDLFGALTAYRIGKDFQKKEVNREEQIEIVSKKINKFEKVLDNSLSDKSDKEYLVLLCIVFADDGIKTNTSKQFYAIDKETGKIAHKYTISNRNKENAASIVTLQNGSFPDYYINKENYNMDSLANTVSDPVIKFIIEPIK